MLARSKLNSAGSLGSKKGPAKGFWACAWVVAVVVEGFWFGIVEFAARLKDGEVGDGLLNCAWFRAPS